VKKIGRESVWLLAAGVLFILAGIRDWVAPGFFSIAGRVHGDIELNLLVGILFIAASLRKLSPNDKSLS
jgi:hypothetical protein